MLKSFFPIEDTVGEESSMAAVLKFYGKAGTGYEAPSISLEGTLAEINVAIGLDENQSVTGVAWTRFQDLVVYGQGEYHEKVQAAKANYVPKG